MTHSPDGITRRAFVRLGAQAAGAVGLGGALFASAGCEDRKPKPGGGLGKRFEYDIKELSKTDPALIRYAQAERLAGDLGGAKEIACDGPAVWVAIGDHVRRVDAAATDGDAPNDTAPAPITALAIAGGTRFIGTRDSITRFAPDGKQAQWSIEGKPHITSIAVHGENVFVADAGNRIVWRFDREGKLISRIGDRDTSRGVEGFIVPSPLFDCAVDPTAELLWVANTGRHRMEAYSFDGEIQRMWGTPSMGIEGFCGCCNPCHFALLLDGRFITSEKGLPRVKRYTADGAFDCVVAGTESFGVQTDALSPSTPASQLGGPLVAIDDQQRVLVLHPAVGDLLAFAEKGGAA